MRSGNKCAFRNDPLAESRGSFLWGDGNVVEESRIDKNRYWQN